MTTTINADSSNGFKVTADTSSILALQTNGTTAISIDASQAVSFTNQPTYSGGTANGVAYLNGSKVLTTGSALVFDGTNLGVGTSSPAQKLHVASAGTTAIQVQNTASTGAAYLKSTNTATTCNFGVDANGGYIETLGAYSTLFYTNGSERARIDSSGNLGLGVTPSAWATLKALQIGYAGFFGWPSTDYAGISSNTYYTGSGGIWNYISTNTATRYTQGGGSHVWGIAPSGTAGTAIPFRTSLTLSGNISGSNVYPSLQVNSGTATELSTAKIQTIKQDNNTTTSNIFVQFLINDGANGCGQITANGANTAAFGSYSDERLKENVVDLEPQLANIMSLRAVEFDYIESEGGGHQVGFIAQNMEQIYPDVVGEREDGMKMIAGWSKTEARLVKAIQEMKAIIDTQASTITQLQADVASLKGASA